ncbi:MAG: methyltransferase domain-containing protein, partial [Thermaurantiacus sp.]
DAFGIGVDRSHAALRIASANADRMGFGDRARFLQGDWGQPIDGLFDLILCNPPYIAEGEVLMPEVARYEPAMALRAGPDGLAAFRAVLPHIARMLPSHGVALVEAGLGQSQQVEDIAIASALAATWHHDLAGRRRACALRPSHGGLGKPIRAG